jgi:hypothetical protein
MFSVYFAVGGPVPPHSPARIHGSRHRSRFGPSRPRQARWGGCAGGRGALSTSRRIEWSRYSGWLSRTSRLRRSEVRGPRPTGPTVGTHRRRAHFSTQSRSKAPRPAVSDVGLDQESASSPQLFTWVALCPGLRKPAARVCDFDANCVCGRRRQGRRRFDCISTTSPRGPRRTPGWCVSNRSDKLLQRCFLDPVSLAPRKRAQLHPTKSFANPFPHCGRLHGLLMEPRLCAASRYFFQGVSRFAWRCPRCRTHRVLLKQVPNRIHGDERTR